MLTLLELDGGKVHKGSLSHMNFHRTKWLDLKDPSQSELKELSEVIKVPLRDLHRFLNRDELPRVADTDNFSVVIFKSPGAREHTVDATTAVTFLISERLIITLHKDVIPLIDDSLHKHEEVVVPLLEKGTEELFYHLVERVINQYFTILDDVELQINRIEDLVFSHPSQKTVKRIFSIKRTLIYFHKGLVANRDVFIALQKGFGSNVPESVRPRVNYLYYDCVQLLDVVATYRDVLTGALDIYLSAMSNNMNAIMKRMAAWGTLVLVPTFITGLYGMNFRFMPELGWPYGYAFAWGLIILSIVVLVAYFKHQDWF